MREVDGPSVLLILDSDGYVSALLAIVFSMDSFLFLQLFGGFASARWSPEPHYIGSGECFLFRLVPQIDVYHWTHRNDYFMLCSNDSIAMGGGGNFGIWVDSSLLSGTSSKCATYNNELLSKKPDFEIRGIELWGFVND